MDTRILQISPPPLMPFNIAALIARTASLITTAVIAPSFPPQPLPPNSSTQPAESTMDSTILQIFALPLKPSNSTSTHRHAAGFGNKFTHILDHTKSGKIAALPPAQLASYVGAGLCDRVRPLIRQAGNLFDRAYPVFLGQVLEYHMTLLDVAVKLNEFFQRGLTCQFSLSLFLGHFSFSFFLQSDFCPLAPIQSPFKSIWLSPPAT
ncbi:hypothetical protein DFJ73DRAFT_832620, partial [Zopfochytrium polystomum]